MTCTVRFPILQKGKYERTISIVGWHEGKADIVSRTANSVEIRTLVSIGDYRPGYQTIVGPDRIRDISAEIAPTLANADFLPW